MPQSLETMPHQAIVIFDSECPMCCGLYHFCKNRDRGLFKYIGLNSDIAKRICANRQLSDSIAVFIDGQIFEQSGAVFQIIKRLTFPWKGLYVFSILPRSLTDWTYRQIAKRRKILFRKTNCRISDLE